LCTFVNICGYSVAARPYILWGRKHREYPNDRSFDRNLLCHDQLRVLPCTRECGTFFCMISSKSVYNCEQGLLLFLLATRRTEAFISAHHFGLFALFADYGVFFLRQGTRTIAYPNSEDEPLGPLENFLFFCWYDYLGAFGLIVWARAFQSYLTGASSFSREGALLIHQPLLFWSAPSLSPLLAFVRILHYLFVAYLYMHVGLTRTAGTAINLAFLKFPDMYPPGGPTIAEVYLCTITDGRLGPSVTASETRPYQIRPVFQDLLCDPYLR
jgi:hypothetical protein